MPESPCFETPTLVDRVVVLPSTQVARRILSKAVVQRRARRARRTRDTVGRLPPEQGGLAQGRSQSTACDHHSVTSGGRPSTVGRYSSKSEYIDGERYGGETQMSTMLKTGGFLARSACLVVLLAIACTMGSAQRPQSAPITIT